MVDLDDISVDALQEALDQVEEKTPALRLVTAIAHKHGVTQTELAHWFGIERKTIYNWLSRVEHLDDDSTIRDARRPGRPRKLSNYQLETLDETLNGTPEAVGVDAPTWTTTLVKRFIRDRFGIDYSRSSCRRLMREAGLRARPTRKVDRDIDFPGDGSPQQVWISQ